MSTYTGLNDVQVIPTTTRVRGLATEVILEINDGLNERCVLNAQQLQLVPKTAIGRQLGVLNARKLADVCFAIREAVGC